MTPINKNIAIIGAGWIGMDWVNRLFEEGHNVRYTKRSTETQSEQFYPFSFGDKLPPSFFDTLDFLFITASVPKENEICFNFIEQLRQHLPINCIIVFTSTIGVYSAESVGIVDEESLELKKDSAYYQLEQLLLDSFPNQTTILRLGGLIGKDRHPVFSLSGRKNIADGQKAVNLVHKGDILCFFECILRKSVPSGIYNLVYPKHPFKKEYYIAKAKENNLEVPEFMEGTEFGKIVCSEKSRKIVGFDYRFSIEEWNADDAD